MLRTYTDPLASSEELSAQYDEERDDNLDTGAFAGGVESGWYGLRSSLNNALAAGGRILGADQFAQNRERAADVLQQRAAGAGHMLPKFEELSGPGDVGTWAAGVTGQNLPLLAIMAGSGVAGGAAGAALLRRAGLAKSIGRAVGADELLNAKRAMLPDDIAQLMSAKASKEAEEAALNRSMTSNIARQAFATDPRGLAARVGGLSGVIAPYFGTTAGDTYSGLRQDPDAVGTLEEKAKAAAMSGAAQTSIGTLFEPLIGIVPRAIHKRLAKSPLTGTKAGLAELGIASLGEGMTETGEQAIQQYTQNQFNPNAGYNPMQLLEAGLAGALVGGVYSAPNVIQTALKKAPPSPTDTPDVTDSIPNRIERISTAFSNLDPQSPSYGSDRAVLLATQANLLSEHKDKLGLSTEYLSSIKKQLDDEITSLGPEPAPNSQYHEAWTRKRDLLTMGKASITASLVSSMPGGEAMANEPEDDGPPPELPVDFSGYEGLESGTGELGEGAIYQDIGDPFAPFDSEEPVGLAPPMSDEELAGYGAGVPTTATPQAIQARLVLARQKLAQAKLDGNVDEALMLEDEVSELDNQLRSTLPAIGATSIFEGTPEGTVRLTKNGKIDVIEPTGIDASSRIGDKIVGKPETGGRSFINLHAIQNVAQDPAALATKLTGAYGKALEIAGIDPVQLAQAISTVDVPSGTTPDVVFSKKIASIAKFLYNERSWFHPNIEEKPGDVAAALVSSLTDGQRAALGIKPQTVMLAKSVLTEAEPDPTGRYQNEAVSEKYLRIVDTTTGDELVYPRDIIASFVKGEPLIFNGDEIPSFRLFDAIMAASGEHRKISLPAIMNSARYGAEFRREDRDRPTFQVEWDRETNTIRTIRDDTPKLALRLTPLQKEFGVVSAKIKSDAPEGFALAKAQFIRMMKDREGKVLVGSMDNNLYFASPENSIKLFKKFRIANKLKGDMNLIERMGVLLKKQSGMVDNVDLSIFVEHPEWTHTDATHDGLMVRAPGIRLAQGVGLRTVTDPKNKKEVQYEADKGMMRGLLSNMFAGEPFINAAGKEDIELTKLDGDENTEKPSLNTSLQFGYPRDMGTLAENPMMQVNRMFPPPLSKGGKANLQQILFGFLNPLAFLRRDRKNRFSDPDPYNQLPKNLKKLAELGIPPARLIKREEIYNKNTAFAARTSRAYTLSSELVTAGDVKLLKNTYLEINRAYRNKYGENLKEGAQITPEMLELILHRDPSLSDGSSMGVYRFAGLMALDTGDVENGIVVNPNDPLWKEAAGDFDGDSGVIMLPDDLVKSKKTLKVEDHLPEDQRLTFVKKGPASKDPYTGKGDPLAVRAKIAKGVSENERKKLLNSDPINNHIAARANPYAQMMGSIMATAQMVSELGLEGMTVTIPVWDQNGNDVKDAQGNVVYRTLPIMYVLAKLGQGSVSAKKKATWHEKAVEIYNGIQEDLKNNAPDLRSPVTGAPLMRFPPSKKRPWPIYWKEQGFNAYFRDVAKSPLEDPTEMTKELMQRHSVSRASRVMQQLLMHYEPKHSSMPEYEDAKRDLIAHLNMFNTEHNIPRRLDPETASLEDIVSEWDRNTSWFYDRRRATRDTWINPETHKREAREILSPPFKIVQYISGLVDRFPNFQRRGSHFNDLLAERPITVELALRALAVNETIEVLGALDKRRDIPSLFKQGAQILMGVETTPGTRLAKELSTEHNKRSKNMEMIDKEDDPEAWEAARFSLSQLNRQILAAYRTGQISPLEMIAAGPPQSAVSLVPFETWNKVLDAVVEHPEVAINIPVVGSKNGQQVKPSDIKDGIYAYDVNTKEFSLVKGIDPETGELLFTEDTLKRAPTPTIASEQSWSRLDLDRFITARTAESGFLVVRKPKELSSRDNTTAVGVTLRPLSLTAAEDILSGESLENVFRKEFEEDEAKKAESQFVDHIYLTAKESASDFTLIKEVKPGTNSRHPEGLASDKFLMERNLVNPGDKVELSMRYLAQKAKGKSQTGEEILTPYEWVNRIRKPNWSTPNGIATIKAWLTPHADGTDRIAYLLITGVRQSGARWAPTVTYLGDNLDSANEFLHQWKIDNGHITQKEVPSQNKTWAQQEATITDGQVQTVLNYPGWDALLAFHNDPDLTNEQKAALDIELRRVVKRVMAGVKTVKEYAGDHANIEQDTNIKPIYLTMDRAKALETIKVWLANEIIKLKRGNGGSNTGGTAPPSSPTPPAPPAPPQAAPTAGLTDKEANEGYTVTGLTVDSSGTFNYVVEQTLDAAVSNTTKAQHIRARVLENAGTLDRIGRRAKTAEDKKAYERALADYKKYSAYGNSVADGLAPRAGKEGLKFTEQKPAWLTLNKEIMDKIGKMSIPELRKFIHNQLKRADAEDAASAAVNGRVKNISGVMRDEAYAAQRRLNILTNRPENENLPSTIDVPYDEYGEPPSGPTPPAQAAPNTPAPQKQVEFPRDGSKEASAFYKKVSNIIANMPDDSDTDVLPPEFGGSAFPGDHWITGKEVLDYLNKYASGFKTLAKSISNAIEHIENLPEEAEEYVAEDTRGLFQQTLDWLYPITKNQWKARVEAEAAGQVDWLEYDSEASPNEPGPTNEVPGPSSLTDDEHLASISNPAIQDRLQNTASSWATLMGTSPIKLVSAKEMYDYLVNRNQGRDTEIAAKILLHAKGAKFKTGVSGVHVTSSDGTHWIYVSTKGATEENATNQAAILAHEFGHTIAMKGFSELKANNKILAAQVEKAWKQFAKQKGYAKEGSPSYDEAVNQARFNEWLADNIGTWMLTDTKPRNAVQSWFKDMADKFMRAWNFVSMTLTRVTRGKMKRFNTKTGDAEVPLSIKDWMDSLAKPSEYIEYLAGPDSTTESLKDRMDRRAAVLKNWAAGTGPASVELINEMVPYIKANLNNLLGVADANMLRRNAFSPAMRKRLVHLLGTNTKAAEAIEENADTAVAYLWALSTWGILKPSGEERTALNKLQQMLKYKNRMLLEATDDEMDEIISRLNNPAVATNVNDLIIPPDSPAARLYKTMDKRYKDGVFGAVQRAGQTYKKMFGWYIDEPYMRILNTGNPTLIEFAKLIQPMAYELGGLKRAGMVERTRAFYQLFAQHAAEILTPLSEQEQAQLADVLYHTPNTRIDQMPESVQKAAKSIRHLLDRIFDYEVDNGVDINKRDRYWPMILNHEYITQNLDAVLALYSHAQFMPGWFGVKEDYKKWIEDELVHGDESVISTEKAKIDEMWARDPKEFIKFYITNDGRRLLPGHALNQLEFGRVHTPGFRFMNPRELDFLLTAEDPATGMRDEDLHRRIVGTLEPDLGRVLQRYIRSAAKRSEHSHLLKRVGGKEGIKGLVEKALAEPGAEAKDVQLALDYLTAVQGMLGLKERDWIDEHIEKWTKGDKDHWMADYHSGKARVMNDNLQKINSYTMMWTNLSHLTLAFAAASADPLTQLAHHGDYKIFMQSFKETVDAIRGAVKTASAKELEQMIDWVGTEERSMSRQDIEATYASNYMSRVPAKVMDTFFRWNGVESITELSRGMSSRAAFHALAGWAKTARESTDPAEVEKATIRLHEHGITPEDVVLTQEGNIKIMPFAEHFDATPEERERDVRVRAAIHRFVDESTIRPDPTNRALMMSNPYYAILTMWKPFVVAFNTQILRPAWARMVEQGDATPIAYLALSTIPMLLFMDMVRDAIKMSFSDDEDKEGNKKLRPAWKSSWTLSDHVLYATERAGFLGNHELVTKIIKPITEGKVPEALTELGGVVSSDIRKVSQWGSSQIPYPLRDLTNSWGSRAERPRTPEEMPEQMQLAR